MIYMIFFNSNNMIRINDVCCINLKKKKLVAIHKYLLGCQIMVLIN